MALAEHEGLEKNARPSISDIGRNAVGAALGFGSTDKVRDQRRRALEIIFVRCDGKMPTANDVRDYENILNVVEQGGR